jgi:hypothetical protein
MLGITLSRPITIGLQATELNACAKMQAFAFLIVGQQDAILVLFRVLELNLRLLSFSPKILLYNVLGFILDKLDNIFFDHQDNRQFPDSVGWAFIAQVASILNVAYWRSRLNLLLGRFEYNDFPGPGRTHLRFFTLKTAKALFEGTGYKIIKTDYTGWASRLKILRAFLTLFAFHFIIIAKPER